MAIPTRRLIEIPLLHLIYTLGGEVRPEETFKPLAEYFNPSEEEQNELLQSEIIRRWENRVHWARFVLTQKGFLDGSIRGIWKITEKGKKELEKLGLLNKPFSKNIKISDQKALYKIKKEILSSEDEELIQLVIEELLSQGNKTFPDDFINDKSQLREIEVPGTELYINRHSRTLVISPKGYFRYQARNPAEAKYIIYANKKGQKKIKMPMDNLSIFRAVTNYEKYVSNILKQCFELFLDFTYDEAKAESLTQIVKKRLGLKEKLD